MLGNLFQVLVWTSGITNCEEVYGFVAFWGQACFDKLMKMMEGGDALFMKR